MTDKPNRHDGPCWKCGTTVPAGSGVYSQDHHQCEHPEGACKTTTKTWGKYLAAKALADFLAENKSLYSAAGYEFTPAPRFESPDVISGHGLRVLVGGDKRGSALGHGVRVYRVRDSQLLGEYPRPVYPDPQGACYHQAYLDMTTALIALIDSHKGA